MYRWIFCLLLATKAFSATPIDGLYATAFGGFAAIPNNMDMYVPSINSMINQVTYNSGFSAGGSLGYKTALWRYEAEVTYLDANIQQLAINQVKTNQVSGYNQGVFGFANVYFDFPYHPALMLQPFIGGGIGYGWLQNNFTLTETLYQTQINNSTFAYQGTVGISFHFSEDYSLSASYRYMNTPHIDTLSSNFQAHLINGAIIYRFDSCEYK